jgi:hypothetical protein
MAEQTKPVPAEKTVEVENANAVSAPEAAAAEGSPPTTTQVEQAQGHADAGHPAATHPNGAGASFRRHDQRPVGGTGSEAATRAGNGGPGPDRSRDGGFPGLPPRAAPARQDSLPRGLNGSPGGNGNGGSFNGGQQPGVDQRRTLHLSLGQASGDDATASGSTTGVNTAPPGRPPNEAPQSRQPATPSHLDVPIRNQGFGAAPQHHNGDDRVDNRPPVPAGPPREPGRYGHSYAGNTARDRYEADPPRRDGGGSFIDSELRARVDTDIAVFLSAFDAALAQDTQDSRTALREATDRLLRAGARTRIELERLEARVPLPSRDGGARSEPAWRSR